MPLHVLALVVEVEPGILYSAVVCCSNELGEVLADSFLRTLLIDKVDYEIVSVVLLLRVHVALVSILALQLVLLYRERWSPFQVRCLLPDYWNTASSLKVSVDVVAIVVHEGENLFCLREVAHVALEVRAS